MQTWIKPCSSGLPFIRINTGNKLHMAVSSQLVFKSADKHELFVNPLIFLHTWPSCAQPTVSQHWREMNNSYINDSHSHKTEGVSNKNINKACSTISIQQKRSSMKFIKNLCCYLREILKYNTSRKERNCSMRVWLPVNNTGHISRCYVKPIKLAYTLLQQNSYTEW